VKKNIPPHIHAEIWPANTIRVHVQKRKKARRTDRNLRLLIEKHVRPDQPVIERAKAHVNVQRVAAQPRKQPVAEHHHFAIGWTMIDLCRLQVWPKQSISRIEDKRIIRIIIRVKE